MLRAMRTMEVRLKRLHKGVILATGIETIPVIFLATCDCFLSLP